MSTVSYSLEIPIVQPVNTSAGFSSVRSHRGVIVHLSSSLPEIPPGGSAIDASKGVLREKEELERSITPPTEISVILAIGFRSGKLYTCK